MSQATDHSWSFEVDSKYEQRNGIKRKKRLSIRKHVGAFRRSGIDRSPLGRGNPAARLLS